MTLKTNQVPAPDPLAATFAAQCIAHRLKMIHRVITGIYNQALRAQGLDVRVSQMNILTAVTVAGPLRPNDLCGRMKMDASTVSRNVDRLIARGWIKAFPGKDDRSHLLAVTPKGKKLMGKGASAWRAAQKQTQDLIGKEGVEAIHRLADRVLATKELSQKEYICRNSCICNEKSHRTLSHTCLRSNTMDTQAIFGLQFALSLLVIGLIAKWTLAPRLKTLTTNQALFWLTLPHAFRHIGMVFLVPSVLAQPLPDAFALPAAYGDLAAGLLALLALAALRHHWTVAITLTWLFNIVGFADLLNALRHTAVAPNFGSAWYIPTFLVPLLLVTHAMIFARLFKSTIKCDTNRNPQQAQAAPQQPATQAR